MCISCSGDACQCSDPCFSRRAHDRLHRAGAQSLGVHVAHGAGTGVDDHSSDMYDDGEGAEPATVVVVGGGVCGLSTALYLARNHGARVVVLEREAVGAPTQASSVNCGHITAAAGVPTDSVTGVVGYVDRHNSSCSGSDSGPQLGWSAFLIAGSMAIYRGLQQSAGHNIEFMVLPELFLAETPAQLAWAAKSFPRSDRTAASKPAGGSAVQQAIASGSGVLLQAREVAAVEPALATAVAEGAIAGAVWFTQTGTAHPRKAMLALAEEARSAGVTVVEGAEVYSVQHEAPAGNANAVGACDGVLPAASTGRWRVRARLLAHRCDDPDPDDPDTGLIDVAAGALVVAAGGWTPYVVGLAHEEMARVTPVVPVVGQMWSTVPQDGASGVRLRHLISSMESHLLWESVDTSSYPGNPPFVTHVRRESDSAVSCPHQAANGVGDGDAHGDDANRDDHDKGASWDARITRHLYGKPTADGRLIFGGDRRTHPPQAAGRVHPLPRALRDAHAVCHDHATSLVREARDLPVEQVWGGIMPFSIDGIPIIGRVSLQSEATTRRTNATEPKPALCPQLKQASITPPLYVLSGLGPSGFMKGPMAGMALAAMMAEDGVVGTAATRTMPSHQLLARVSRNVLTCASPSRFV